MGNTFKTAFLLTLLTLLLMFIGRAFGGQNGMILALVFAAVLNFVSYFYSDKIALAMYRARPVTREELPRAYAAVERLTQKIGIPMPKMYVIPSDSPNAFATGRNPQHASVAVTQGILNLLNDEELEGVLAHELGHVNNRDILISSVVATLAGAIYHAFALRIFLRRRSRGQPWRWAGRAFYADSSANRGFADSACGFALPRISGRCNRRAFHRQSLCSGQRLSKNRCLLPPPAVASHAVDGASIHHSAISRDELRQPVLDTSAYRKTNRAANGAARRVYAIELSAVSYQPSAKPRKQDRKCLADG